MEINSFKKLTGFVRTVFCILLLFCLMISPALAEDGVIINISKHRKPDGTFNIEQNLKVWNAAVERFHITPLWEKGKTPNFDDRDPLQIEPSIIFVPGKDRKENLAEKRQ